MEHIEPALSRHRGKYLLKLPPRKDSVEAIIGEYNAAMEDIGKEKIRKTIACLAEEKKVSFLDSTVMLHAHVFVADRAARPRYREKRERKEGEGIASGKAEGAGSREEESGKRKEGPGMRKEGDRSTAIA